MIYDWIKEVDFAYPEVFGLFGLVALLIFWYVKKYRKRQATMIVSSVHPFSVSSWRIRFLHLPFIFRVLGLCALIVALARPQKRNDQEQIHGEGIDIVLCMDVSGSMGSKDILPSRMDAAKEVAEEFVRNRPVDRIGLVIFAGESFSQCPITNDRNTLISQIQSLESRKYLADGTVIGEGLATAVARLEESTSKSKVIILLTDGKEDPPETRLIDPLTALEIAKASGVKVYTVGVSAAPSTVVEIVKSSRKKQNPAVGYLDEDLLRRIASETGGRYFRAKDREGLKNIYGQIDKLEKSKIEYTSYKRYEERFLPFLMASLAFLLLEFILRYRVFRKFP
jgi:Ca-activated chloride channel family protein